MLTSGTVLHAYKVTTAFHVVKRSLGFIEKVSIAYISVFPKISISTQNQFPPSHGFRISGNLTLLRAMIQFNKPGLIFVFAEEYEHIRKIVHYPHPQQQL